MADRKAWAALRADALRAVPKHPDWIVTSYERAVVRRAKALHEAVLASLDELLLLTGRRDSADADLFFTFLAALRARFAQVEPNPEALGTVASRTATWATKQVYRQVPPPLARVGVNVPAAALDTWVATNVSLIKSIDPRYFDDVERVVLTAVREGQQTSAVRGLLEERYQVSRSRAQLIARDQISKLNGDITKQRQSELGITEYVWLTSNDERVRPEHRALQGKVMRWDTPHPTEGHPGEAIQCRCVAKAVIPLGL